jgi:hypothetical protein
MKGKMMKTKSYMETVKAILEMREDLTAGQKATFDIARARFLGEQAYAAMLEAEKEDESGVLAAMKVAIYNGLDQIPANASAQRMSYDSWLAGPKATPSGHVPAGL